MPQLWALTAVTSIQRPSKGLSRFCWPSVSASAWSIGYVVFTDTRRSQAPNRKSKASRERLSGHSISFRSLIKFRSADAAFCRPIRMICFDCSPRFLVGGSCLCFQIWLCELWVPTPNLGGDVRAVTQIRSACLKALLQCSRLE